LKKKKKGGGGETAKKKRGRFFCSRGKKLGSDGIEFATHKEKKKLHFPD